METSIQSKIEVGGGIGWKSYYAKQIWNIAKKLPGIRAPAIPKYIKHAAYKCYIYVEGGQSLRDLFMNRINQRNVPCFTGSCSEVYLEKAFVNTNYRPEKRLVVAKELSETSLMFLCHPTLTQQEIDKTCMVLEEVVLSYYFS